MLKLLSILLGAVLLSSAAHGDPYIYLTTSQCLNARADYFTLEIPGMQIIPFEIQAAAFHGAQTFEFSIPGFTAAAGILVSDLVPNPEAVFADGNPFAEGARILFASCQAARSFTEGVTLYSGSLFVVGPSARVPWTLAPHTSPMVPGTTCAIASPCDGGSATCVYAASPRTHPGPPNTPSPRDGAKNVTLHPELGFSIGNSGACTCLGVACLTLYLGEALDPPLFFGLCDMEWPKLDLKPSTTYYWRVDVDFCGYVRGPVWSFTTGPLAVEAANWSRVKEIFR